MRHSGRPSVPPPFKMPLIARRSSGPRPAPSCCARGARPRSFTFGIATLVFVGTLRSASASPGEGHFLAGIEAQGPASTHLSAVFHNPAMLTDLPGLHLQLGTKIGVTTQRITVAQRDAQGMPLVNTAEPSSTHRNLGGNGFLAASFLFEKLAVAAAYYSLDGNFVETAPKSLSAFVRSNPSPYCRLNPAKRCPASSAYGGWAEVRSEFTLAVAWASIRRLRLGIALHFPRYSLRGGRIRDSRSEATQGLCKRFFPDDPQCEEIEHYDFHTSLRGHDPAASRIQLGMTAGVAWAPNNRWTFGARYRMRPNFGLRSPVSQGRLQACALAANGTVKCQGADASQAQLVNQPGRQVALGASFRPYGDRSLHLDLQAYWIQNCPDNQYAGGCQSQPDARITVIGGTGPMKIVDRPWYRGRQDRWGGELWVHRSLQRNARPHLRRLAFTGGIGGYSGAVHASAHNPIDNDGPRWFGAGSLSIELLRRNSSMFLVGGYVLGIQRSREIGISGTRPAFAPDAFATVRDQGQGIDGPAGEALMSGRAKASNAGRYHSVHHTASIALRWGARD